MRGKLTRPSWGKRMLNNRKLAGWVCGLMLAGLTLVNSFACVLYCQVSRGIKPLEHHSCCANKRNSVGTDTIIRSNGSLPCPAEMALLSDVPLILRDNSQSTQLSDNEFFTIQPLSASHPLTRVSQPLAILLKFLSGLNLPSSSSFLSESALRI